MKIRSALFARGVTNEENIMQDELPQIAFIGRSNVGKSSIINSLCNNKKLARSSATAGRTQEINFFLINNNMYFVDLPGYGYARGSYDNRETITERINWYFFEYTKVQDIIFLIIDARVGMTDDDIDMFEALDEHGKNIIIIINKIDKVNQNEKMNVIKSTEQIVGNHKIILCSAEKHTGIDKILEEIDL